MGARISLAVLFDWLIGWLIDWLINWLLTPFSFPGRVEAVWREVRGSAYGAVLCTPRQRRLPYPGSLLLALLFSSLELRDSEVYEPSIRALL